MITVAVILYVIIHESDLKISCLLRNDGCISYSKFLLEFSLSKEEDDDDPLVDTRSGKKLQVVFFLFFLKSHKEMLILTIAAQASLWNVRL